MKKIFSMTLTVLLILSSVTANVWAQEKYDSIEALGDYEDKEYMYDNFELNYDYNGEMVVVDKNEITRTEFDVILRVLSDEHLSSAGMRTEEAVEVSDEMFPDKGYVEFLDKDDGNWIIAFDKDEVYAGCINPSDKTFRHGFFTYNNNTIYNAFTAFLDGLASGEEPETEDTETDASSGQEETPVRGNEQTGKQENKIKIYDKEEIYSASFPLDRFSGDFSWGICSYRREGETKPVTVAYITFEDMEILRVITDGMTEDNTIAFDDKRTAYFDGSDYGYEYDTDFSLTHKFELQVEADENMQVKNAKIKYRNVYSGETKTADIDMSTYKQSGSLPVKGNISFSAADSEMNKEETKEETRIYRQNFVGDINKFILREKFHFTFVPDKSFEGVLTEEVAEIGEEVSVEVRIYLEKMDGTRNGQNEFYNVTILEGSKGKAQLWGGFDYELDYFPLYKPTDMVMHAITANRYITGAVYEPLARYSGEGVYNHRFMMKPEFDGNEITGMKIKYVPEVNGVFDTYATMDGAKECDNVKYELLVPFTEMTEKEEKEEKALENRNPEKYVTTVRGKMNDGSWHDYRINSVYQASLEDLAGDLPEWYEALGSDVNLYLLSFTQVWDGKDRNNYTMIKLEGSRGRVWFINGNAEFGNNQKGGKYVVCDYDSLISFDGFERVRNTVDYDTVTISIDFATDEDMTVEGISVEVEGEEVGLSDDEITYIGGGKLTYESFF